MRKVLVVLALAMAGCGGGSTANSLDTPEYRKRMKEEMEKEAKIRKALNKGAYSESTNR